MMPDPDCPVCFEPLTKSTIAWFEQCPLHRGCLPCLKRIAALQGFQCPLCRTRSLRLCTPSGVVVLPPTPLDAGLGDLPWWTRTAAPEPYPSDLDGLGSGQAEDGEMDDGSDDEADSIASDPDDDGDSGYGVEEMLGVDTLEDYVDEHGEDAAYHALALLTGSVRKARFLLAGPDASPVRGRVLRAYQAR